MLSLLFALATRASAEDEAPPVAPVGPSLPASLVCSGTEPFWSIRLKDGKASAASPDRPEAPLVDYTVTPSTHHDAFLVSPKGKGPGFRWLTVRTGTCKDGMSDQDHPYSALALSAEAGFVSGCCRVAD